MVVKYNGNLFRKFSVHLEERKTRSNKRYQKRGKTMKMENKYEEDGKLLCWIIQGGLGIVNYLYTIHQIIHGPTFYD